MPHLYWLNITSYSPNVYLNSKPLENNSRKVRLVPFHIPITSTGSLIPCSIEEGRLVKDDEKRSLSEAT